MEEDDEREEQEDGVCERLLIGFFTVPALACPEKFFLERASLLFQRTVSESNNQHLN